MGFLNSLFKKIIIFLIFPIMFGCSSSIIKIDVKKDNDPYTMFGRNANRDFYYNRSIGDSILKKWEADIHGSFTNSSVTVYNNFVFVNDLSGRIFCFNINSGEFAGQLKYKGPVYTTPVIDDFEIIFAYTLPDENRSVLCYYDFQSGKEVRGIKIDGLILSEIIKTDDRIIFNTENGILYSYNLSGEQIWECRTKSFSHSSPAMAKEIIVFGNDEGEIIGVNSKDGKIIYRNKIGGSFFGSAAVSGNITYIGNDNGNLYALGLENGEIIWQQDTGGRIIMTPAVKDSNVIIGNLKGSLISFSENGSLNWRNDKFGVLNASPALFENKIILPDLDRKLFIIDISNGKILTEYNFDGRIKLSPVLHKNLLFIGYDDGILAAYEIPN